MATKQVIPDQVLPAVPVESLEARLEAWSQQRKTITKWIAEHLKPSVDWYDIKGRKSLSKPGSEKAMALLQLKPSFHKDDETWEMLGRPAGILCYVCTLVTPSGEFAGEGRGARDVKQDKNDVNKAIKMATKSAQVDAVLRVLALSEEFTQDLEDLECEREALRSTAQEPSPVKPGPRTQHTLVDPTTAAQRTQMTDFMLEQGSTPEKVDLWWQREAAKHPDLSPGYLHHRFEQLKNAADKKAHAEADRALAGD